MEPTLFILFGGVVAAVLVGSWVYKEFFSARGRARRALRKAPRVPIAQAKDGEVAKLAGRLRLVDAPLTAPLTGRPCAYFRTMVEQQKSRGKSSYWDTIIEESDFSARLVIEDGTGSALVELTYPLVVLNMDTHLRSGFLNDATPELGTFLSRHGVSSQGWVFNKTLRYKEGALEEGEKVAVFGLCRREPDPDPQAGGGYRDRPMRLRVVDPPDGEMLISDEPETV
jgi:hypothetical protein